MLVQVVVPSPAVREELGRLLESAEVRVIDVEADGAVHPASVVVVSERPLGAGQPADEPADDVETLTPREREVLDLLAEGLSNKAIGVRLEISEHTAKFHVASVLAKLGAANRADAVRRGVRRGWVSI